MQLRNAKVKTFGAIQYVSLHSFIEVCNLGNCMGKQIKYSVSTKTLIHEFCTFFRIQDSGFFSFFSEKNDFVLAQTQCINGKNSVHIHRFYTEFTKLTSF